MATTTSIITGVVAISALAVGGYFGVKSGYIDAGLKAAAPVVPERKNADAAPVKAPVRKVRTIAPEAAPATFKLTLPGRTAPVEQAAISTRATGIVVDRKVDIGDKVQSGDVLAVIEAPEIEQEYARAKASVEQNQARVALARSNVERAEVLIVKGHVSEQVLDERRASLKTAEADVAFAAAEVRRLEEVRKFQVLKAPFAGTIVARNVDRGDKVSADTQSANYLFRIAHLDELRVEIDVPQSVALSVKVGASGKITFAELPNEVFAARVVRVSGLIDPQSSTMRAELLMPNPEQKIPAGLNGQVLLEVARAVPAYLVPSNTIVVREGRQNVVIVDAGSKVALRSVTIGRDLGEKVEVVSGLTASDLVILSPNALLKAGDQVELAASPVAKADAPATR